MSSNSFSSEVSRKSLKQPDSFYRLLTEFFQNITQNSRAVILGVAVLLALGVGVGFYLNHSESHAAAGQNSLFWADKAYEKELKALEPSDKSKKESGSVAKAVVSPSIEKSVDVEQKFPETLKKLLQTEKDFSRTRAGFEARLKLGDLYYHYNQYNKALPWYQKAVDSAPANFEKAVALASLGYTYENLGNSSEAIQTYQKALNLGEGSLKGDLLLGVARGHEAAHDNAKARSIYDQILADLPNTEFAKSAEIYKAQLQ